MAIAFVSDVLQPQAFGLVDAVQLEYGSVATPFEGSSLSRVRSIAYLLRARLLESLNWEKLAGGRHIVWQQYVLEYLKRPLLGYGVGASRLGYITFDESDVGGLGPFPHPHSLYVQIMFECGVVVVILLCSLIIGLIFYLAKRFESGNISAVFAVFGILAGLLQSVFDPILLHGEILFLVCLMVAVPLIPVGSTNSASRHDRGAAFRHG